MNLSFWIALHYLRSRRTVQFSSLITFLSLTGIVVGVAAIICVSSIFNGFRDIFQTSMLKFDPHLRIKAINAPTFTLDSALQTYIQSLENVITAEQVLQTRIVFSHNGSLHIGEIQSIDSDKNILIKKDDNSPSPRNISSNIILGNEIFIPSDSSVFKEIGGYDIDNVNIGIGVANALRVTVGDTISLLSPEQIESMIQSYSFNTGKSVRIQGIFALNAREYDNTLCLASKRVVEGLRSYPRSQISSYDIRLTSDSYVETVSKLLKSKLPANLEIQTWYDLHKDLYKVMQFERMVSFFVLSIIIFVACFTIFALLTMGIVKKKHDIALMKSLGASDRLIQNIFLFQGLCIGIAGTFFGVVLGLGLCYLQSNFSILRVDTTNFIIAAIPIKIAWWDVLLVVGITLMSTFLATYFPARQSTKTPISYALRSE